MKTLVDIAKYLGVDRDTVSGWCANGELRATNVARNPRGKRPRWRIADEDLAAFIEQRANRGAKAKEQTPARQRRKRNDVIEFF